MFLFVAVVGLGLVFIIAILFGQNWVGVFVFIVVVVMDVVCVDPDTEL